VERDPLLKAIARILRERAGFDLASLDAACARRRVMVRARANGCEDLRSYLAILERDAAEIPRLRRALHVTVSTFFRDPGTFRLLESTVFPEIFRMKSMQAERRIRVVSAGCATGEEPYSLAMSLLSGFAQELSEFRVSVLGLDGESEVLRFAEAGVYPRERLEEVPPSLLHRYFSPMPSGDYRVNDEVRALVSFERRDLSRRSPPANTDLLVCRNTLIYFERKEKEEAVRRFADALSPAGYLVLGRSEVLPMAVRPLFTCVSVPERVYRKR
jgi:chemotaxis protein methyltransferase CheR